MITITHGVRRRLADLPILARSPKQAFWRIIDLARMAALLVELFVSRRSITGDADVVVSLTTFGERIRDVPYVLQTMRRGTVRPRRVILWLDDDELTLPRGLSRLKNFGLEILMTEDLGPYKKQIPYSMSVAKHVTPVVTADDDVFYPRRWLADLVASYDATQDVVIASRARQMSVMDGVIAPYSTWRLVTNAMPSRLVFPTGVSGVMYPPRLLEALKARGMGFLECAPRADDVWVHLVALREGFSFRQIHARPLTLRRLPGTDGTALMAENVTGGGNDSQISASYTRADVSLLTNS